MRLVHCADLHLGHRQFDRVDANGRNLREQDVMRTFRTLVDRMIAIAPELIIVCGDVMHVVRPGNGTIIEAFAEFSRLAQALPTTVIIVVAGNHDLARTKETASILQLFAPLGIHVVDHEAQRLTFAALDLSVLAVPDSPFVTRPVFAPDPAVKYSVLALHGEVQGMLTKGGRAERAALEIPTKDLGPDAWTYIGLGHYHVHRLLAPNMAYSGSIDFTSTDPWGEQREAAATGVPGKGFVERNLDTGEHTFHPLPVSRAFVELPTFSAHEMDVVAIDDAIAAAVEACEGGIDGKVVRLVVTDVAAGLVRELDHKAIKSYKVRALNFFLDWRRAEVRVFGDRSLTAGARQKSLDEIFREFIATRELPPDIDRARFTALANKYMAEAEPLDQASTPLHDEEPALVAQEQSLEASVA